VLRDGDKGVGVDVDVDACSVDACSAVLRAAKMSLSTLDSASRKVPGVHRGAIERATGAVAATSPVYATSDGGGITSGIVRSGMAMRDGCRLPLEGGGGGGGIIVGGAALSAAGRKTMGRGGGCRPGW